MSKPKHTPGPRQSRAAPELLEALEDCASALSDEVAAHMDGDIHPTIKRHAKALKKARAAIAKAKGEQ